MGGDEFPRVRAAAVQASSVFLDREKSTAKACALIREAGAGGADIIAFPEGFIPAHPVWFHFHPATGEVSTRLSVELFKNAVEIPGPEIGELAQAAADAQAYVVVGVCEKIPNTTGTLYNSQVFLGPDGALLGKRRKLMPTVGERLVHTGGDGDSLAAFNTRFGPASALICGENSNPLAIFALTAQYSRVHVMSWPNHFPAVGTPMRDRVAVDSQAFAQMSKAFVISACGTIDDAATARLELSSQDEALIRDPDFCGGSVIVAPDSRIIAGPLGNEEAILYADLDLDIGVRMKLRHDFAGHYNRPDIFQVTVNAKAPQIFGVVNAAPSGLGEPAAVAPGDQQAAAAIEPIYQRAIGIGGGGDT